MRTDAICGGSAGVLPLCSSRLASIGNGAESEDADGNAFAAEDGAWKGAGGGLRLSGPSTSSGSSSNRFIVGIADKIKIIIQDFEEAICKVGQVPEPG